MLHTIWATKDKVHWCVSPKITNEITMIWRYRQGMTFRLPASRGQASSVLSLLYHLLKLYYMNTDKCLLPKCLTLFSSFRQGSLRQWQHHVNHQLSLSPYILVYFIMSWWLSWQPSLLKIHVVNHKLLNHFVIHRTFMWIMLANP